HPHLPSFPTRRSSDLGTHGHDHRVLHLLSLDQAEHFGAVILLAIRPAQTTPSHRPTAQVYTLETRRVDENLITRYRFGHSRDCADRKSTRLNSSHVQV